MLLRKEYYFPTPETLPICEWNKPWSFVKGISVWKCCFHTEAKTCWLTSEVCRAQQAPSRHLREQGHSGHFFLLKHSCIRPYCLCSVGTQPQRFRCCFYLEGAVGVHPASSLPMWKTERNKSPSHPCEPPGTIITVWFTGPSEGTVPGTPAK